MHTLVQGDLILIVVCLGKERAGAPGLSGLLGETPGRCGNRKPTVHLCPWQIPGACDFQAQQMAVGGPRLDWGPKGRKTSMD